MTAAARMLESYPADVGGVDRDKLRACIGACVECAQACTACADECESHAGMHEHCRICAEACRRCERACRDLLGSLGCTGNPGGAPMLLLP